MRKVFAIRNGLIVLFLFFLAIPTKGLAQSLLVQNYFKTWDKDENKKLSHAEFYDGISDTYLYETWDKNENKILDRQEFYDKIEEVSVDNISANAPDFSTSRASISSRSIFPNVGLNEYIVLEDKEQLFTKADLNRDGNLNKAEFYTFIFRMLDKDENGFISPREGKSAALRSWF